MTEQMTPDQVKEAADILQDRWSQWLARFDYVDSEAAGLWREYRDIHSETSLLCQAGSRIGVQVSVRMSCDTPASKRAHKGIGRLVWNPRD